MLRADRLGPCWEPKSTRLALLVVSLAAARLREPAADHVADGEDRDVQPCLLGPEAAGVGIVHDGGGDQNADRRDDVRDELGGLERGLRLGGDAAGTSRGDGGSVFATARAAGNAM